MRSAPYLILLLAIELFAQQQNDIEQSFEKLIKASDSLVYDNPVRAMELADSAFTYSIESGDDNLRAIAQNRIGLAHWSKGELIKAIAYLIESKELADQVGDSDLYYRNIGNLANVYSSVGLNASAITLDLEALEYFSKRENANRIFVFNNNIAKSYMDSDELDSARKYFAQAKDVYKSEFEYMLPIFIFNIAELAYKSRKLQEADSLLNLSMKLAENRSDKRAIIRSNQMLAELAKENDNLEEALSLAEKAYEMSLQTESSELIMYATLTLANIYLDLERFEEASKLYKSYEERRNSIEIERVKNQLEIIRFLDQQNEIVSLTQRNQYFEGKAKFSQWVIMGLVVLLLVITYLTFKLLRRGSQIESQKRSLQDLTELQSKILGIVSHDIRSPIVDLYSLISLIQMKADIDEMSQKLFGRLNEDVDNILFLLDSLVKWAKQYLSGHGVQLEEIELELFVDQVISDLDKSISGKNITIVKDFGIDRVISDPQILRIILRNILLNAIKFSHKDSSVEIRIDTIRGYFQFMIKDFGVGMNEQQIQTLFVAESNRTKGTTGEKGSGVGLALCKNFIELIGGEIQVESAEGIGSSFRVLLPKTA